MCSIAAKAESIARWSMSSIPNRIDSLKWRSLEDWYIMIQVFDTMVFNKGHYGTNGSLLKKWSISKDRKEYKFYLKENIYFSNGEEITSKDAIFSIKRYLVSQNQTNPFKQSVLGADNITSLTEPIKGLNLINKKVFQITLKNQFENIWSFLLLPMCTGIVREADVDTKTNRLKKVFASSGAYYIEKMDDSSIILKANKYYREYSKSKIQQIVFTKHSNFIDALNYFKLGKTNIIPILEPFNDPLFPSISTTTSWKMLRFPYHRVGFILLNNKNNFFKNKSIRKKIRNRFSYKNMKMYPEKNYKWSNSFFPKGSPGYMEIENNDSNLSKKEVEIISKMKVLLEKGVDTDTIKSVIRDKISPNIKIEYLYKKDLVGKIMQSDYDIVVTSIGLPIFNQEFGIYLYFLEDPKYFDLNISGISEKYKELSHTTSIEDKTNLLKQINSNIQENASLIPIYSSRVMYYYRDPLKISNQLERHLSFKIINFNTESEDL